MKPGCCCRYALMHCLLFGALALGPPGLAQTSAPERVDDNEICLACHDALPAGMAHSRHKDVLCEDCHGPGSEHIEAGGGLTLAIPSWTAGRISDTCMSCHQNNDRVVGFGGGAHGKREISCVACHELHTDRPGIHLLKSPEVPLVDNRTQKSNELCATCHRSVRADLQKPYSHPVLEGGMTCTQCHNPHLDVLGRDHLSVAGHDTSCVQCHSDVRGPFVFEHAPLKLNGCQSCHQPHGSVNAKMLNRPAVHQLCLECHSMTPGVPGGQPPSFHDIRSPRYRNCTTCHRAIHGSNVSPLFLR